MEKTAMQELIEKLEITNQGYYKKWKLANTTEKRVCDNAMSSLTVVIMAAKKMLEKEKQQIIDAWDLSTAATASDDTGIEYYNQTYKQND